MQAMTTKIRFLRCSNFLKFSLFLSKVWKVENEMVMKWNDLYDLPKVLCIYNAVQINMTTL